MVGHLEHDPVAPQRGGASRRIAPAAGTAEDARRREGGAGVGGGGAAPAHGEVLEGRRRRRRAAERGARAAVLRVGGGEAVRHFLGFRVARAETLLGRWMMFCHAVQLLARGQILGAMGAVAGHAPGAVVPGSRRVAVCLNHPLCLLSGLVCWQTRYLTWFDREIDTVV